MTSIGAIIPTVGHADELPALVDHLTARGIDTAVIVNRPERAHAVATLTAAHCTLALPRFVVTPAGWTLYRVWNMGIRWGRLAGHDLLLILNDDIVFTDDAIETLERLMRPRPEVWIAGFDYHPPEPPAVHRGRVRPNRRPARPQLRPAVGTIRHGGIGGFAFAVRPCCVPLVDESFTWWGGDDDLVFATYEAGGDVCLAVGAHVTHPIGNTSGRHYPELDAFRGADLERAVAKWGR